jgi:hypothetical protein
MQAAPSKADGGRSFRETATKEELAAPVEAITHELDFPHYALILHDDLRNGRPDLIDLRNYPAAITERIVEQQE